MGIGIIDINHVNVVVTPDLEDATKRFYSEVLGLTQIPKPEGPRQFVGAWYQIGDTQIHLSIEDEPQNSASDRHVCYRVADLQLAAEQFRNAGVEVTTERRSAALATRFFVRDPGGNFIEITI